MQQVALSLIRLATAAFTAYVVLDFFKDFPGKKQQRFQTKFPFLAAGAVLTLCLYGVQCLFDSKLILNALLFAASGGVLLILYRIPAGRLYLPAIPALISLTADLFVMFLERYAQDAPRGSMEETEAYLGGVLAARLLFFAVIKIASSLSERGSVQLTARLWYGLMAIPFGSVILMLRPVARVFNSGDTLTYYVVGGLVLLYINVAVFSLFDELMQQMENKNQLEMSERILKMEQHHYKEMENNRQAIRAIWHDMKNHISAMQRLADEGEFGELHEYLDGLQREVGQILHFVDTGNPALDAVLNEKQMRARQCGVVFELSAAIPPKLDIDPLSIVSILSNALDNAIEACVKLKPEERVVTLLLTYKSGFLGISIKNPTDGMLFEGPAGGFQTGKEDKEWHGIGLKNIRSAVDRLEGQLRVTHIDNVFGVNVVVPARIEQPKAIQEDLAEDAPVHATVAQPPR